jgi:hypothetical protein
MQTLSAFVCSALAVWVAVRVASPKSRAGASHPTQGRGRRERRCETPLYRCWGGLRQRDVSGLSGHRRWGDDRQLVRVVEDAFLCIIQLTIAGLLGERFIDKAQGRGHG